jgi:succinate dehydrogenase/fumarate reductase cytochrome b subunit
MFVWVFHRVSGVLLILLLALKFVTGFALDKQFGQNSIETFRSLHNNVILDLPLLFLFIFHSVYGLRTILFDLGIKKEKELFWGATIVGAALFVVLGFRFYLHA